MTTRKSFIITAQRPCLDFVNTEVIADGKTVDLLESYHDLVVWARSAGALDASEAAFVLEKWPAGIEADAALEAGRALRRQLRSAADHLMRGLAAPAAAIDAVNLTLRSRPGYLQLEHGGDGWAARWKVPMRRPDDVLWRIARSAASMLADDDPQLIKRCERAGCGLYFYDTTKNRRKRWCRMEVCGAAARSAAYYARKRAG